MTYENPQPTEAVIPETDVDSSGVATIARTPEEVARDFVLDDATRAAIANRGRLTAEVVANEHDADRAGTFAGTSTARTQTSRGGYRTYADKAKDGAPKARRALEEAQQRLG